MITSESISLRNLRIAGAVLLFWGLANTAIDLSRYGLASGEYWWFCNLALVGTGLGCLIADRGLVVGFLAIALFTQIFWIVDDLAILIFSKSILGLAIQRQRPDFPLDEFFLSQYHYFTIPIGFLGWGCPELKSGSPIARVALFNPIIFGVSYFLFSAERNINCIHATCLPNLGGVAGPGYALTFWLATFAIHLVVARGLEKIRKSPSFNRTRGVRHLNILVSLLIGLGVLCSLLALSQRA